MSAILKQRYFLLKKEFELNDRSLKIKISTPLSFVEDEINFEDVILKITRKKVPNFIFLGLSMCLFIAIIITVCSHFFEKNGSGIDDILVYVVLFIIFSLLLVFTYENEIKILLFNGKYLSFYPNSPTKEEVLNFIEKLKTTHKECLLNRYAKADPYLSPEQLSNNLKWLWERKVIDDTELHELKSQLLPKSGGGSSVGFKFNPMD